MTSTTAVSTGGLSRPLELLAGALGEGPAAGAAKGSLATAKAGASTKAGATAKATAKKTTAAKTTTKKSTTAAKATGYATKLPADYAFLRDPKLSIEEKLSRFIGLLMAKSEQDLLQQLEKMAPGSTAAAGKATSTGGTSGAAKPKSTKFSLWGLAKNVFPALNLASKVVGDAQLKALATQLSGPVLAAAATAVGLPQLAPLAQKYGPQLVGALTKDITIDLAALTGGATSAGSAATGAAATSTASGTAKATSADPATSEKAQLMELQRLQDRDKELFTLFSNMLKAMHDARMTSIQNIR